MGGPYLFQRRLNRLSAEKNVRKKTSGIFFSILVEAAAGFFVGLKVEEGGGENN